MPPLFARSSSGSFAGSTTVGSYGGSAPCQGRSLTNTAYGLFSSSYMMIHFSGSGIVGICWCSDEDVFEHVFRSAQLLPVQLHPLHEELQDLAEFFCSLFRHPFV